MGDVVTEAARGPSPGSAEEPADGPETARDLPALLLPRWLEPVRNSVRKVPGGALIWKIVIGVVGGAIVALGFLLIPLPGPGWAIVFLGLAVWATEFHWAARLLNWSRGVLRDWMRWAGSRSVFVRSVLGLVGLAFLAGLAYLAWKLLR